jgi:hypothetical protein
MRPKGIFVSIQSYCRLGEKLNGPDSGAQHGWSNGARGNPLRDGVGLAASDRSAFLDRKCANDPGLRRAIEDLLSADVAAGSFLRHPVFDPPTADDGHASQRTIGPYTLLEVIGQGEIGVPDVDDSPVER